MSLGVYARFRRSSRESTGCEAVPVLIVVAPGQGSQRAGMLAAWRGVPVAAARLADASSELDVDLVAADGDAASARAYAQELLVALGQAAWAELTADRPRTPHAVAGHSVGELTIAAVGGALAPGDALRVTRRRAEAMRACAEEAPGGLVAAIALGAGPQQTPDDVDEDLDCAVRRAAAHGLSVAVVNAPSQLVLGGPEEAIAAFLAESAAETAAETATETAAEHRRPRSRLRLARLDVAGAFHTSAMAPAVPAVAAALDGIPAVDRTAAPAPAYVRGVDGGVGDGPALLAALPRQVASPVRWDLVTARIAALGATGVLELPPAGTLTGLLRRAHPAIEVFALRDPADIVAARAFVDSHLSGP